MAPKYRPDGTVEVPKWTWRGILAFISLVGFAMLGTGRWILVTQYAQAQEIARLQATVKLGFDHVEADLKGLNDKFDRLGAGNLALLP